MLRVGRKPRWLEIYVEWRDAWVGVYWTRKPADYWTMRGHITTELHLYVCLVPCLPIHIVLGKEA